MKSKWLRFLLAGGVVFCAFIPLMRQTTSDFAQLEGHADYLSDKLKNDTWSLFSDAVEKVKDRLYKEDDPPPLSQWERTKYLLLNGFGYGINTIGATDKTFRNATFKIYHIPMVTASGLLLILIFQFAMLLFGKTVKYLAFLALIAILLLLLVVGFGVQDSEVSLYLIGWLGLLSIQLFIMITVPVYFKSEPPLNSNVKCNKKIEL